MQFVAVIEHAEQLEWHAAQSAVSEGLNSPAEQGLTQTPEVRVASGGQAVQPLTVASVQLEQLLSHASHVPPALANLSAGQMATHAPESRYGVPVVGQVRQPRLVPSEHVSHVA